MTDLATYVAALDETWGDLAAAVTGLTEEQWNAPTDLPGWSVQDNVAHVCGIEALLAGEPYPGDHVLPGDLPHVKHEFARYMEVIVDVRRPLPGEAVLAELRDVAERRLKQLRALDDANLGDDVPSEIGTTVKLGHLLGRRAFDCWTHEQDVRRALGLPPTLTARAAEISRRRLLLGLTSRAEPVPALVGRTVVVETTGAIPSVSTLAYASAEDATYADGAADAPDVRLVLDVETFLRLGTGRVAYDAVAPSVTVEGDAALGEELLRAFAITP